MKTIDEAIKLVAVRLDTAATEARQAEIEESMRQEMRRRESLTHEIVDNPEVNLYVKAFMRINGPLLNWNTEALALNMFVSGVLIGIEMEKQETIKGGI